MSLGAIGAFLVVLLVVFVVGNLWFHFVEGVLERIKGLFRGRREPPAWLRSRRTTNKEEPRRRWYSPRRRGFSR